MLSDSEFCKIFNNGKSCNYYSNDDDFDYNSPYFTRPTSNNQNSDNSMNSYSSIPEIPPFSFLNPNDIENMEINNDNNISENNIITLPRKQKIYFHFEKITKKKQGRKKKGIKYDGPYNKSSAPLLLTKVKIHLIKSLRKYLNKKIKLIYQGSKKYKLKRVYSSFSKQNTKTELDFLNKKIKEIFFEENERKNWNKNAIKKILKENKDTELVDILNNKTLKDMHELFISNAIPDFCLKNNLEEISKEYPDEKKFVDNYKETAEKMIEKINKKKSRNCTKKN
jgi:hypothetical protein